MKQNLPVCFSFLSKVERYVFSCERLKKLKSVDKLNKWLEGKRKIYSFDLLSGHSCPFAKDCKSKVEVSSKITGRKLKFLRKSFRWLPEKMRRRIVDGPDTKFRCFSASQEVLLTGVFNKRLNNFISLKDENYLGMRKILEDNLPADAGIVRIHVAGDFFKADYFAAWLDLIKSRPDILFYAYTKSLPYWIKHRFEIPENFMLTASRGGSADRLIDTHGLREAVVVESEAEAEAMGLDLDWDDSHAALPGPSFALMVHGPQPAGTNAAKVITASNRKKAMAKN